MNLALPLITTASWHIFLYFQFAEKFQEVKEQAKLARDKSQEKVETLSNHSQVNNISVPYESLIHFISLAFHPFHLQSVCWLPESLQGHRENEKLFHKHQMIHFLCLEMASGIIMYVNMFKY